MRIVREGYRGVSTLAALHRDRMLAGSAVVGAVMAAAWLQSL